MISSRPRSFLARARVAEPQGRALSVALVTLLAMLAAAPAASAGTCGQPISSGGARPSVSDCLVILRRAVISTDPACDPFCICDVDGDHTITASDASRCLRASVGLPASLNCACTTTTTTTLPPTETRDQRLWPFDALSPWNHPLGSGATFAADTELRTIELQAGHAAINTTSYSHPIFIATSSDPLQSVTLQGSTTRAVTYRIPADAAPSGGSDAHMHVIDPNGDIVHETWRAARTGDATWTAASYAEIDLRGSGIAARAGQNIGTRAYGGSAIGGLIRTWEVQKAGKIQHAVAVSLMKSQLQAGPEWPATAQDPPGQYSGHNPMGTLIAIRPEVDLRSLGLSAPGLMVARALQDYGAYAVDTGNNGPNFYAEPDLDPAISQQIGDDVSQLLKLLYPVTNNRADNVGGGGSPRAPLAPPFANPN
jgi:hypothetical protein